MNQEITKELIELNDVWIEAWFKKDSEVVDRMMGPEYVYVTPGGQILDRDAILAIIRSPGYHLFNGSRTEVVVKLLGDDFALILFRWQGEGEFDGTTFKDDQRGTMVVVRRAGQWQVVHEHCSNI